MACGRTLLLGLHWQSFEAWVVSVSQPPVNIVRISQAAHGHMVPQCVTLRNDPGFPPFDHPGFKIGKFGHLRERADPDCLDRDITAADEVALREAVSRYFPLAGEGLILLLAAPTRILSSIRTLSPLSNITLTPPPILEPGHDCALQVTLD